MKRLMLLTVALLLVVAIAIANTYTRNVHLTFPQKEFKLCKYGDAYEIMPLTHKIEFGGGFTMPYLPSLCINILIGGDEEIETFTCKYTTELMMPEIKLINDKGIIFVGDTIEKKNTGTEAKKDVKTCEKVRFTGLHDIKGYRVATFLICPFSYDQTQNALSLDTDIDLQLQLKSVTNSLKTRNTKENKEYILSFIENPQDMESLYGRQEDTRLQTSSNNNSNYPEYIIITADSLCDEFQQLAEWKMSKGVRSEVISVEDIYTHYTDSTNQMKIKHKIMDLYNSSSQTLKYVLLGGDNTIVPAQECYSEVTLYLDSVLINCDFSDMYYACLQNLNWDTNRNGLYAELSDSISLEPNIIVTRLPVINNTTANNIIEKIIKYEVNPDTLNWDNEILLSGVQTTYTINGRSDTQDALEGMYDSYIANSFWNGYRTRFFDTYTDFPSGSNYDVSISNLVTELNKGYAFVAFRSHGTFGIWFIENGEQLNPNNLTTINNNGLSILASESCFHNMVYRNSIGATLINNLNTGIVASYGTTCQNITSTYGMGAAEYYTGTFYSKILSSNERIGEAVYSSKTEFRSLWNQYNPNRWLHLYLMPFCDPEMPVFTTTPCKISNLDFTKSNESFTLYYESDQRISTCLMSRFDKGNTTYEVWKNENAIRFNETLPQESLLTITLGNHIPYRAIFYPSVFLQNESLKNNLNVIADVTYIGRNVNNNRPQGPVTVENGHSVISSTNGVVIQNDFEVKLGATLEINCNGTIQ